MLDARTDDGWLKRRRLLSGVAGDRRRDAARPAAMCPANIRPPAAGLRRPCLLVKRLLRRPACDDLSHSSAEARDGDAANSAAAAVRAPHAVNSRLSTERRSTPYVIVANDVRAASSSPWQPSLSCERPPDDVMR